MILSDDVPEEAESLRSYHVQDPAQTNSKDLARRTAPGEVLSCVGKVDQIQQNLQNLLRKKRIISIPEDFGQLAIEAKGTTLHQIRLDLRDSWEKELSKERCAYTSTTSENCELGPL